MVGRPPRSVRASQRDAKGHEVMWRTHNGCGFARPEICGVNDSTGPTSATLIHRTGPGARRDAEEVAEFATGCDRLALRSISSPRFAIFKRGVFSRHTPPRPAERCLLAFAMPRRDVT